MESNETHTDSQSSSFRSLGDILGDVVGRSELMPSSEAVKEFMEANELTTLAHYQVFRDNQMIGDLDKSLYDCEVCLNRGFSMRYEPKADRGYYEHCKCLRVRESIVNAQNSGLGNLADHRVANYEATQDWQKELKNLVVDYVSNSQNEWIALMGQSGSGKTMLCAAIANVELKNGKEVAYMPWRMFIDTMKRKAFDDDRVEYFNSYADSEVLYIDDMFKGSITKADADYAFNLINYRYNKGLKTLITSELHISDMLAHEQDLEAVASRIKEKCSKYFKQIKKDQGRNYRFKEDNLI